MELKSVYILLGLINSYVIKKKLIQKSKEIALQLLQLMIINLSFVIIINIILEYLIDN
jgi:hypothetical protein